MARVARASLASALLVAAGAGCLLDPILGLAKRDVAAEARSNARSDRLLAEAEEARGRDDWPCPPDCSAGFVCVHSELVGHGICRPRCDLEVDLCTRPARCTPVAGADPACVDPATMGTRRPQVESVTPPPPLLDP